MCFSCLWTIDGIQNRSQRRRHRTVKFTIDSHRGDDENECGTEFHGGKMDVERKGERERERRVRR